MFPQPRELNKLSCFLVFLVNNTGIVTMKTNIRPACGKNKKIASNASQLSLLLPASPAQNIISFRAQIERQIALFPKDLSFSKASVYVIFHRALSYLYCPRVYECLTSVPIKYRCFPEIECYRAHTSMLQRCVFHEICKQGQQDRDILDDRIFNGFRGMACFPVKSQFTLLFSFLTLAH